MLDPRYFQENVHELEAALKRRNIGSEITSRLGQLSQKRRELIQETENLKAKKNAASQEIARLKAQAKNNPQAASEADAQVAAMRAVGDQVKALDENLKKVEEELQDFALRIPNIPHSSVPEGQGSEQNIEIRKWGNPPKLSFQAKEHPDLGEGLGILDFERAGKISGARFALYLGAGAALERALIQFMLDLHTREHGYQEVIPPFLVTRPTMTATGQLPKFEEDLLKLTWRSENFFSFLLPRSR